MITGEDWTVCVEGLERKLIGALEALPPETCPDAAKLVSRSDFQGEECALRYSLFLRSFPGQPTSREETENATSDISELVAELRFLRACHWLSAELPPMLVEQRQWSYLQKGVHGQLPALVERLRRLLEDVDRLPFDPRDAFMEALGRIENRFAEEVLSPEVASWGIPELDARTLGLKAGTLTLLGGLPGTLKTAFGLALAKANSHLGKKVLYLTSRDQPAWLAARLIGGGASVLPDKLVAGDFDAVDFERMVKSTQSLIDVEPPRLKRIDADGFPALEAAIDVGDDGLVIIDGIEYLPTDRRSFLRLVASLQQLAASRAVPILAITRVGEVSSGAVLDSSSFATADADVLALLEPVLGRYGSTVLAGVVETETLHRIRIVGNRGGPRFRLQLCFDAVSQAFRVSE